MTKQQCLFILGVNANATQAQIKRAYRQLALLYHPDKNQSKEAANQFIQINEAYQRLKENDFESFLSKSKSTTPPKSERERKQEARRKRAYAANKKRHEAYINSKQYKIDLAYSVIHYQIINILLFILFLLSLPTIVFPIIILVLAWNQYKNNSNFFVSPKLTFKAIAVLNQETNYVLFSFFAINLIFASFFVFDLFVPTKYLLLIYSVPLLVGFILYLQQKFNKNILIKTLIVPFCISLVFMVNSVFSHPIATKTYVYKKGTWLYQLEQNQLQDCILLRLITSSDLKKRGKLQYHINQGYFGWKIKTKTEYF